MQVYMMDNYYDKYMKYKKKYLKLKGGNKNVYLFNFGQPSKKHKNNKNTTIDERKFNASPYKYVALYYAEFIKETFEKLKFELDGKLYYYSVVMNINKPDYKITIYGKVNFEYTFNKIYGSDHDGNLIVANDSDFISDDSNPVELVTYKPINPQKIYVENIIKELKENITFEFINVGTSLGSIIHNQVKQFIDTKNFDNINKQMKKEFDKKLIGHYGPSFLIDQYNIHNQIYIGYWGVTDYQALIFIVTSHKYKFNDKYFNLNIRQIGDKNYYVYVLYGIDENKTNYWTDVTIKTTINFIKRYKISNINDIYYSRINDDKNLLPQSVPYDKMIDKNKLLRKISKAKNNKKMVLFYTGAGISYLNIPNIKDLYEELQHSDSIENVLMNPKKQIKLINQWFKIIRDETPTKAHYALTNILSKINNEHKSKNIEPYMSNLITSNFDKLHQKAGFIPLHFHRDKDVIDEFIKNNANKIYMVIGIGLSLDRANIIKMIKEYNNNAKVIIVGLDVIPDFVITNKYYFIDHDVQELLPFIDKNL